MTWEGGSRDGPPRGGRRDERSQRPPVLRMQEVDKTFSGGHLRPSADVARRERRASFISLLGTFGLRQVYGAAADRRAHAADRGPHPVERRPGKPGCPLSWASSSGADR
jgi:hypothetical protein